MTYDPLSPFGRGANAPLAGRTILQIVPPLAAGGDERATLAVAAALVEAGARALIASDPSEFASEVQAVGGLHVPFPAATRNPLSMTLNVRRLARILDSERVELAHARARGPAWVALGACRSLKRPLVTSLPTEGPASAVRSSFESAAAEGDLVIVGSNYAAERAAEAHPEALMRLRVVRPGLDLAAFAPEAISRARIAKARQAWQVEPHERVVLAPAQLALPRGQRILIEAAALLRERGCEDVRFVLAGDAAKPAYARELDALAERRGVKPILTRLGASPDRAAALAGASVVVFPATEAEGVTRTAIEAAATGAPIVISDVGTAPEIVAAPPLAPAEQRTGWLVPPRDAAALADAIEAALTLGASAREALRTRGRARIAKMYSIERMTRDTLKVYAEALGA